LSLAAESGPWECYLLINNDAQAERGMVSTLEQVLYAGPKVGMVAPYTRDGDETFCGIWYQRHTGLVTQHRMPGSFYYLSVTCLLIRSELAESGLFDESFFMYGEDVELSWRLHRQGFVPRCIPGALLHHAGIGSSHPGQLCQ